MSPAQVVRETWSTRSAFVLAAIGSAVGLGNLWGFPYKLYTYGGGAFLIPYFIAMLVMGIPLLIMEFSVGHWAQQAPPGAFGSVLKKYRYVGWWLVLLAFIIITYYSVILAYCVDYLIASIAGFGSQVAWAAENTNGAQDFFFNGLLNYEDTMAMGMPAGRVVGGTIIAWILVYLCLFRGVKWVSKVVLLTVPLPWIMLVILTARGLTLEGAIQGLEFYLEPRWEKLLEPDTWRFAFGQVFFSMSLGFAVMLSYASFLHRSSDINNNALIIGLGDMGTSFIAGIAVFSMLGGMSLASGTAVPDLVPDGTVGLSFVVFPYGLAQLPFTAFFSTVFFLALLTLGIDSAFSIVEACLTSVCDSKPEWPRKYVLPGICVTGCALGLVFTSSRGGLNWLGLVDGLINGPFGILIVALAECLVVGWAWQGRFVKEMRNHANERSDWRLYGWWDVIVRYVAPALLGILIVWSVSGEVHAVIDAWKDGGEFEFPYMLAAGSLVFIAVPIVCRLLSRKRKGEEEIAPEEKHKGVRFGVLYVAIVMVISAAVIELGQFSGWLGKRDSKFTPDGELGATAYIVMTVAMLVIFGGVIWCFWRALCAADKREDTPVLPAE